MGTSNRGCNVNTELIQNMCFCNRIWMPVNNSNHGAMNRANNDWSWWWLPLCYYHAYYPGNACRDLHLMRTLKDCMKELGGWWGVGSGCGHEGHDWSSCKESVFKRRRINTCSPCGVSRWISIRVHFLVQNVKGYRVAKVRQTVRLMFSAHSNWHTHTHTISQPPVD